MIFASIIFYLFSIVAVVGALNVILQRNPVHSVLWLILTFFNSAGLFVLLGAEFIAMVLVVVYVGAVAVLFLFVVMMLDINTTIMREGFLKYLPIASIILLVFLIELITVFIGAYSGEDIFVLTREPIPDPLIVTNTESIGNILYTDYIYLFQSAGVVLLVAMIGAIVLTHRRRPGMKRQNISKQIDRSPKDTLEIIKVDTGKGIT
ncbi:MAG: NADH:ubiquinone oxidoreductase subunit J [Alphaproteobacteria bacterium TMED87]|nr:MAG: NADH:ubiquinone oxidoreductase subunit J [Alphaproteobacteria bacterium TMED87]